MNFTLPDLPGYTQRAPNGILWRTNIDRTMYEGVYECGGKNDVKYRFAWIIWGLNPTLWRVGRCTAALSWQSITNPSWMVSLEAATGWVDSDLRCAIYEADGEFEKVSPRGSPRSDHKK